MNEKITLQDLINLFGEKQGMNKKDAELFVRNVFDLIEETLATEKYVKVKGLGTFKLTEVDSRESVNVNTGERIEIQGHTKVSFTPDTTMKDLINKPFAHFETVILNDGVELEDIPTEEATIPEMPEETPTIKEEVPIVIEETPVIVEEVKQTPTIQEELVMEMEEIPVEKSEIPKVESVPMTEEPKPMTDEPIIVSPEEKFILAENKKNRRMNRILWAIIVVLVLIILFGGCWLFIFSSFSYKSFERVHIENVSQPEMVAIQEDTISVVEKQEKTVIEHAAVKDIPFQTPAKDKMASLADTLDYEIVGTKTTYVLKNGESIIKASVKFYGAKMFWPYIVKHNRDIIKNADNIPVGIEIKIPELRIKEQ